MKNKERLPKDYKILAILITLWLTFIGVFGNYVTDLLNYLIKLIKHVVNERHLLDYLIKHVVNEGLLIIVIKFIISALIITLLIILLYKNKKKFKFYSLANEKDMEDDSFKAVILPISTPSISLEMYFYYFNTDGNGNEEIELSKDDIKNIKQYDAIENLIKSKNIKEIYLQLRNEKSKKKEGSPIQLFPNIEKYNNTEESKKILKEWLEDCEDEECNKEANTSANTSKEVLIKWLCCLPKRKVKWNWSVPLLIAAKNFKKLEHIILIGSKGEGGSEEHLYLLNFILLCLFPCLRNENSIITQSVKSFENFTELTKLLDKIEDDLENKFDYKDEEIAFDITGGQKLVSVVGTFFTLKSRTPILYISQEDKFGTIKEINAIINIEPPE